MINQRGGVNGRKIRLISLDDGYSPPKTVEQTRRLVEQEEVLAIFSPLGTPPNTAIHKYLNAKKVPQILLHSSANKWNDPAQFPVVDVVAAELAHRDAHLRQVPARSKRPNAKIAVLYQNDDYGKDLLKGLRDALGDEGRADDRRDRQLRSDRSDHRFADRQPAGIGRGHVVQLRHPEVRRAGDPQGL